MDMRRLIPANGWKRVLTIVALSVAALTGIVGLNATITDYISERATERDWIRQHRRDLEGRGGLSDRFLATEAAVGEFGRGQKALLDEFRAFRAEAAEDRKILYRLVGTLDAEGRAYVRDGGRKP